jgi:hypothetical protein
MVVSDHAPAPRSITASAPRGLRARGAASSLIQASLPITWTEARARAMRFRLAEWLPEAAAGGLGRQGVIDAGFGRSGGRNQTAWTVVGSLNGCPSTVWA